VTKHRPLISAIILSLALGGAIGAQEKPSPLPAPTKAQTSGPVPLKVQIVIARYQGDKKIGSVPYTLTVNASGGGRASLRMGAQIAIPGGPTGKDPASFQYKSIGTNIDCTATGLDDGRFKLDINIEDSSVYPDVPGAQNVPKVISDIPAFRSFSLSDSVVLKDGQTSEFVAATDKMTGEVTKIDVMLTVVK
jgi:Flp pilus assembly secretin CpaC